METTEFSFTFLISKLLAISHIDCWLNFESYLHLSEISYYINKSNFKVCPNFVVCTSVIRVCRSPTYFIHDTRENFWVGESVRNHAFTFFYKSIAGPISVRLQAFLNSFPLPDRFLLSPDKVCVSCEVLKRNPGEREEKHKPLEICNP